MPINRESGKNVARSTERKIRPKYRNVEDLDHSRSYAFYGKSGSGKTTFAATFPKPLLLVDIDDWGSDSVSDVKGLKVWEVSSTEELEEVYVFLKSGDHDFETVVLDTLTMLQQIRITELIGKKLEKSHKQPGDWGTMSKADWGKVAGYMAETIIKFRNLDMEVVFLTQQRVSLGDGDELDEDVIDPEIGPSLSKSVRSKLEAAVNVIGNMVIRSRLTKKKDKKGKVTEKERIEYCLEIGPSSLYTRKVRKPKAFSMPEYIADPEYEDLIDILNGD